MWRIRYKRTSTQTHQPLCKFAKLIITKQKNNNVFQKTKVTCLTWLKTISPRKSSNWDTNCLQICLGHLCSQRTIQSIQFAVYFSYLTVFNYDDREETTVYSACVCAVWSAPIIKSWSLLKYWTFSFCVFFYFQMHIYSNTVTKKAAIRL